MPGWVSESKFAANCEACGRVLSGVDLAFACSYGRTFCLPCTRRGSWRCPECKGELTRRARRVTPAEEHVSPRSRRPPLTSIRITRADASQLEPAARLFDAYRQWYGRPPDRSAAREFLRERLAASESVAYLAWVGHRAVGFAQLYPTYSSIGIGRIWILNDLYVAADLRGLGVGSRLLARCERWVRDSGAVGATLETALDNPAQRLYVGRGWTLDREFLHFEWAPRPGATTPNGRRPYPRSPVRSRQIVNRVRRLRASTRGRNSLRGTRAA